MGRRREVTPDNVERRRFWFGCRRIRFEELPRGGAGSRPAGAGVLREWISSRVYPKAGAALQIRLFYRPGGSLNWTCVVYFSRQVVDPEIAEGQGPDSMRLCVTPGWSDARLAVTSAEVLAVDAFAALGDALGYDVER